MASRRFLAFLLLISSWIFVGFSEEGDGLLQGANSMIGLEDEMPTCMQKILPCQPFIKSPTNPSPACCVPLKEMLTDDVKCLCSFFDDAELLKALNVTPSEALKLPQACGADVDTSACNNAGANPPAGSTAVPSPPAARTSSNGSSSSKPSSSTGNNPAHGIGYGFAAASSFVALLLSAL